ncbi:MAG TPA: twin-arginine translocation signal domain-containing protein [Thermoanaerobaculia bacterium]|nr:twin-arginine translocation signal domain-containing protein [Thermoanaerobaculia bacterium]
MRLDRREFLVLTGTAACATAAGGLTLTGPIPSPLRTEPAMIEGDPWLATAPETGLGGHSFEQSRHFALRFRTPAADRDRYVLGLEI